MSFFNVDLQYFKKLVRNKTQRLKCFGLWPWNTTFCATTTLIEPSHCVAKCCTVHGIAGNDKVTKHGYTIKPIQLSQVLANVYIPYSLVLLNSHDRHTTSWKKAVGPSDNIQKGRNTIRLQMDPTTSQWRRSWFHFVCLTV